MFKLRSQQELGALLDEVSALGGRKLVDSYYREGTYVWTSPSRNFSSVSTLC